MASDNRTCSEHKLDFIMYCTTDKVPICLACLSNHPCHHIIDPRDAFAQLKSQFIADLSESRELMTKLDQTQKGIANLEVEVKTRQVQMEEEIKRVFDDLTLALNARRNHILAELKQLSQEKIHRLTEQSSDLRIIQKALENRSLQLGNSIQREDLFASLAEHRSIQALVLARRMSLTPASQADLVFTIDSERLAETITRAGGISQAGFPREISQDDFAAQGGAAMHRAEAQVTGTFSRQRRTADEKQLSRPFGLAVNGSTLAIAEYSTHQVQLWNIPDFKMIRILGQKGARNGELDNPSGITIADNVLYVADYNNHRVQAFDLATGKLVRVYATGKFPTSVAIHGDNVMVFESGKVGISVYHRTTMEKVKSFGRDGDKNGQFRNGRHSCLCIGSNQLFVSDQGNHRIQVFRLDDMKFVRKFGEEGSDLGELDSPTGITVVGQELYVADKGNHRICVFDLEGNYLRSWGQRGAGEGQFNGPTGLVMCDNELIVADSSNNRIQAFY